MANVRQQQLQALLRALLGTDEVYFQPPVNVQMTYPAIVYERDRTDTKFADNNPYVHKDGYTLTFISEDPDDAIRDKILALPLCSHQRFYTADNLNHDVFNLFF